MNVVTRFAPSPTGYLHIGGARTALFNWLFARHHGGQYLLRIEDTDKARSTIEAIDAIHDGLQWLGLDGDMPAVSQSAMSARHAEVAHELIAAGAAYKCFLADAELKALRDDCLATGRSVRSPWRNRKANEAPQGAPFVVRMKMPSQGSTTINDAVQGQVAVQNAVLDDMVILRADGTPTYMLAVVVDDHDMGITHVIRGDDHLNNAFRQTMVYQAMGWDVPVFAHIPLIHGSDGAKLSKRHGALGVDAYRDMGFLPEAVFSYLLRLGWSHGDQDIFTKDEAVSAFTLDHVGKSPARFDLEKLADVNAQFMRTLSENRLCDLVMPLVTPTSPFAARRILALIPLLKERAKTHLDIASAVDYLIHDGAVQISNDAATLLNEEAKTRLLALDEYLASRPWDLPSLKRAIDDFMADNGLKMRDIGLPLRAAVTGTKQSPSIIDIMSVLGQNETSNRIRSACET